MKIQELRSMEKDQLISRLKELRQELVKLRAQIKTGASIKNTKRIRNIKKEIARILTLLNT